MKDDLAVPRERRAEKYARRIATEVHQITACLAEYARRQRVAELVYDDSDRSFLPSFPYHQFKTALANKLADRGVTLIDWGERKKEIAKEKARDKADLELERIGRALDEMLKEENRDEHGNRIKSNEKDE